MKNAETVVTSKIIEIPINCKLFTDFEISSNKDDSFIKRQWDVISRYLFLHMHNVFMRVESSLFHYDIKRRNRFIISIVLFFV